MKKQERPQPSRLTKGRITFNVGHYPPEIQLCRAEAADKKPHSSAKMLNFNAAKALQALVVVKTSRTTWYADFSQACDGS